MMVLGKKCPACGGNQLVAKESVSRIAALPGAKAFMCADCNQQILLVLGVAISTEHRHFERKKMPPYILIRIPGPNSQFARITNISEGGVCFYQQIGADMPFSRFLMLDLYNCNDGSSLEQLPAEIVATTEHIQDNNGIKSTVLSNCARFVDLNQAQKKVLHSCICEHGVA